MKRIWLGDIFFFVVISSILSAIFCISWGAYAPTYKEIERVIFPKK